MNDTAQQTARMAIGLDAAREGDPKGVRLFLDFVQGELVLMGIGEQRLPPSLTARLRAIARDAQSAVHYIDGYCDGKS